jgi:transcriptional/translational regulatory protein YebC/TACO1
MLCKALGIDGDIKLMVRLVDTMDEDDDVQNMYHNWKETESV